MTTEAILEAAEKWVEARQSFSLPIQHSLFNAFIAGANLIAGELEEARKDKWVRVEDGLPKEGRRVIISSLNMSGKRYTDIAFYTYGGEHQFDDIDEDFPECLNEKDGVSYLPKGFWVEDADEEKCYQRTATHWMKLPEQPLTTK